MSNREYFKNSQQGSSSKSAFIGPRVAECTVLVWYVSLRRRQSVSKQCEQHDGQQHKHAAMLAKII